MLAAIPYREQKARAQSQKQPVQIDRVATEPAEIAAEHNKAAARQTVMDHHSVYSASKRPMQLPQRVRDPICWFTYALVAGHLGPGDSRYSRDQLFLRHPMIASRAMAVFLWNVDVDTDGAVQKYEAACERVREYILWENDGVPPIVPFSDDELGISKHSSVRE